MRGVTAVLMLMLAACSTAGGNTTTTAQLAEPSTTTTTTAAASTTTTEPTTTTTEEECVDRDGDGVLRTDRGFVCPPFLRTHPSPSGTTRIVSDIHLPGDYTLRTFTPAVGFTRLDRFTSWGENSDMVVFDLDPPPPGDIPHQMTFSIADHETATRIPTLPPWNQTEGREWATDLAVTDTEIGGFPATITTFVGDCSDHQCSFEESAAFGWFGWRVFDDQWTAVTTIHLPSGPFTIIAYDSHGERGYWTEVAQPILDSIEFLDP